ncbi:MAG: hypothetical protein ACLGIB_12995 [Actinomycetota bacterium]
MSQRSIRLVSSLIFAALAFVACGGDDEPPASREFNNETPSASNTPAPPPKNVPTKLKLAYRGGEFKIDLEAGEEYCAGDRPVTIVQDLKKDKKIASRETSDEGDASLKRKKVPGKYYAQVPSEPSAEYGNLSICKGARSQTVIVKR